ncbi:hypothetical protein EI94DRAFT_1834861 [Lactarius quietus]|nr:hypothetical protein EI94DRAFT_1834861 [Lactarius quietus]
MTSARSIRDSAILYSSNSDLPANGEGPPIPDETSPLLIPKHKHVHQPTISGPWRTALSSFFDDNVGLLLVAASQLFVSLMNLSVKVLNGLDEPVPTFELLLVRMVITHAFSVTYMYIPALLFPETITKYYQVLEENPGPIAWSKGVRTLLVFRGLSGFIGVAGLYFSLQYLSLSDATVLTFLAPILTGFSGAVFLKEPIFLRELLAGLCSFAGVILIARPQFLFGSLKMFSAPSEVTPTQRMFSVVVALVGVVGATGAYTTLRSIGKRAHVLHSMTSYSSQCVLASTIGMILFKQPLVIPTRISWLVLLFLIGIFGFISQIFLTMGLQRETAGRGTLAMYSSIVFAVIFEFLVFHTTPPALSIIGALIIVSSAIYITLTKKPITRLNAASDQPAPNHDGDREP